MTLRKKHLYQGKKEKMKFKHLIILIIVFGCNDTRKTLNTQEYLKTSIIKIIENPSDYNNKKIEIEGYFHYHMEEAAISKNKGSDIRKRIWIDFNYFRDLLNDKKESLYKDDRLVINNKKKIKLKGIYTTKSNGHLGLYSGSIKDISCFKLSSIKDESKNTYMLNDLK